MKKLLLLVIFASFLSGCEEGPEVTVCISDPARSQTVCSHPDDTTSNVPYSETENWVMFTPGDAKAILDYCRVKQDENSN